MFKDHVRKLCPPVIWDYLRLLKLSHKNKGSGLNVYWTERMAEEIDKWGEGNAWNEIKFLTVNLKGKVLDIACGTGETIRLLSGFSDIEAYGFDISDFLIQKAINKGIPRERLKICSVVNTGYPDNFFDYSYSIGSLEHVPETETLAAIAEAYRITKKSSFHMLPVAKSGKDEGWLRMQQNYHNNSTDWWLSKFRATYKIVHVIDSAWEDQISAGKWFICQKLNTREEKSVVQ
jgi:ubiquinone/menaquinone biosynthesis C-methylase UbiE